MADETLTRMLREAGFAFVGTVEQAGGATMDDVPVDDRTLVVRVGRVLKAPEAFGTLAGSLVTLQPQEGAEALAEGASRVFFANGVAFGVSVALAEIGRLPLDAVEAGGTMAPSAEPARLEALQAEADAAALREHAAEADAIVVGRVIALERAGGPPLGEHNPDWWRATLHAVHVVRGPIAPDSEVKVLYANSLDVRWRDAPKPKASQDGLWVLHATKGERAQMAPFQILHPTDFQPPQSLRTLSPEGS